MTYGRLTRADRWLKSTHRRNEMVCIFRALGLTYRQLGDMLGVSFQRCTQIIKQEEKRNRRRRVILKFQQDLYNKDGSAF